MIKRATDDELAFLKELGDKLAELRSNTNYSCEHIAKYSNCTKSHIAEAERGQARLTIYQFLTYCRFLHVTPNELLGYDDIEVSDMDLLLKQKISKLSDKQKKVLIDFLDSMRN